MQKENLMETVVSVAALAPNVINFRRKMWYTVAG